MSADTCRHRHYPDTRKSWLGKGLFGNPVPSYFVRKKSCSHDTLHATQWRAHRSMELGHTQMLQQQGLCLDHVLHTDNRKGHSIFNACHRVDRGGTTATITTTNDIRANYKKLVSIKCKSWTNEVFPPATTLIGLIPSHIYIHNTPDELGTYLMATGMRCGRQASMQENSIAAHTIQLSPCFVCYLQTRNDTSMLELVWAFRLKDCITSKILPICTFYMHWANLLLQPESKAPLVIYSRLLLLALLNMESYLRLFPQMKGASHLHYLWWNKCQLLLPDLFSSIPLLI